MISLAILEAGSRSHCREIIWVCLFVNAILSIKSGATQHSERNPDHHGTTGKNTIR